MIRENQQLFNVFKVILDVIVLMISTLFINSPFFARYGPAYEFNFDTILLLFTLLIPSYLLLYYMFKLYTPQRTNRSAFSESSKIIQVNFFEYLFLSTMCVLNILYVPADFLIFFLVINSIFAIIEKSIIRGLLRILRAKGFNIKYVLVVGAGEIGRNFVDTVNLNTYLGYKIIGFLDDNVEGIVKDIRVIGKIDDIDEVLSHNLIDRVVVRDRKSVV